MNEHSQALCVLLALTVAPCGCHHDPASGDAARLLRVGTPIDITVPSPFVTDGLSAVVSELVFRPLFRTDESGRLVRELADTQEWSTDGRLLTLRLRDRATFSDRSPVGAADVVDTCNRSKALGVWGTSELLDIEALDDRTVRMRTARAFMMPAPVALGVARRGSSPPIGAGPYVVASHDAQTLVLVTNPQFDGAPPGVTSIEFQHFASPADQWSNLLARKVDLVTFVPWNKFRLLSDIPTIRSAVGLSKVLVEIWFRESPPPFDRLEARRALAQAINRAELVELGLQGQGIAAVGVVWPRDEAFDARLEGYSYDPASAKLALMAAGCTARADGTLVWRGAPLRLDVDFPAGEPGFETLALLVQRQLADAGVEMRFRALGETEFLERVTGHGPALLLRARHAASDVLFDDEVRALPETVAADLSSTAALDAAVRAVQRRLRDDAPAIYLVWLNRLDVIDRRFCGLPTLPDGPEGWLDRVRPCQPGEDR